MNRYTIGTALVLLTLTAAAFGQDPMDPTSGTPSAPGPHDNDFASGFRNSTAANSHPTLPDGLSVLDAGDPNAQRFNAAVDEYQAGKLDDAASDLLVVLKSDPKSAPAHKLLAYAYLRQNKPADALPHLEASVKATPGDVQTRDNLGGVYLAVKRPTDAAAQFKAVLALSPKDPTATRLLSQMAMKTTATTHTMTVVTKGGQKPDNGDLSAKDFAKQGETLLKAGKFDDAMTAYNKAAALDPKNADLQLFIGEQYMKAGLADKAIPAISQALALNTPHIFESHTMLGQLYAPTDPAKAVAQFKMAADAKPLDPAIWYNLAVMEAQTGDTADAKQHYQKVMDLHPADPTLADHAKQNLASLGK